MSSLARAMTALVMLAAGLSGPAQAGAVQADAWTVVPYEPKPATYEELPMGEPTEIPWIQGKQLHIGDATIPTRKNLVTGRAGTYLVGVGPHSPVHHKGWWLIRGAKLKRLPSSGETRLPYISANGRWIAWIDTRSTLIPDHDPYQDVADVRQRIVIYDVESRKKVAVRKERRRSEVEDGSNELWLQGIDNTGRALVEWGEAGVFVFSPSGELVPLKVKNRYTTEWDSWPGGAMLTRYSSGPSAVFGRVSKSGRFTMVGSLYDGSGVWSGAGDQFLVQAYGETHGGYVYRLDDGTIVELGIPEVDEHITVIGWESETSAILWRTSNTYDDEPDVSFLVRCNTVNGACERVPNGPTRVRNVSLPQLN